MKIEILCSFTLKHGDFATNPKTWTLEPAVDVASLSEEDYNDMLKKLADVYENITHQLNNVDDPFLELNFYKSVKGLLRKSEIVQVYFERTTFQEMLEKNKKPEEAPQEEKKIDQKEDVHSWLSSLFRER